MTRYKGIQSTKGLQVTVTIYLGPMTHYRFNTSLDLRLRFRHSAFMASGSFYINYFNGYLNFVYIYVLLVGIISCLLFHYDMSESP